MVSLYNYSTKRIKHYSVSACLFPLCAAHGLAITTVEGVGNTRNGLHEVQKRLIEFYGLQCGFCTPGFVMSMFTLLRNDPTPSKDTVEQAIEGNLCRCTGYRSIFTAFQSFAEGECPLGDNCCKNHKFVDGKEQTPVSGSESQKKPVPVESTQTAVFPAELMLSEKRMTGTLTFKGSTYTWIEPATLKDLLILKQKNPDAPVVMGNSAVAFLIKSGGLKSTTLLYGKNIDELNDVQVTEEGIRLGPALTFTDLKDRLKELSEKITDNKKRYFPSILYMVRRYGADQIRNVATLGGSLLSSKPHFDLPPLLAATGASIEIASVNKKRRVKYNGNLDLAPEEILTSIILPYSTEDEYLEFFKVAERRTFSPCTGNGALFVKFSKGGDTVESLCLCFGGFGSSMIIADKSAEKSRGREFNEVLLSDLLSSISEELNAKASGTKSDQDYHMKLASGFLFKFYIIVVTQRNCRKTPEETRSAIELLTNTPYESTQVYESVPSDQEQTDAVGRPIPSVSSQGIVSGEAVFIDDMPKFENELFLSLVTSSSCHATITDVDVSKALQMPGVRGFIDHRDVPGDNLWGPMLQDEEVFASKEVTYVGCTIGAVVADTREQAMLAAKAVTIKYKDLDAIVSLQDAIKKESFYPFQEELVEGDVTEAFRLSDHVIEGEFETGRQEHFYMETQSTIAVPMKEDNVMELFVGTADLATTQKICWSMFALRSLNARKFVHSLTAYNKTMFLPCGGYN
ncbi:hypothetical protein CHS0354_016551 [Potamilus streckersoni]|uniref:FAD-binding PCMH-type domain-containing protein n=1 Tax=Potamilus streckersoni TaxID=2493646 RepID=A0AAE0WF07_9BIVA|nr:hypothetical protein CHS0354_016551 [Potamilus streckersoni]